MPTYDVIYSATLERQGKHPGLSHADIGSQLSRPELLIEQRRPEAMSEWTFVSGSGQSAYLSDKMQGRR